MLLSTKEEADRYVRDFKRKNPKIVRAHEEKVAGDSGEYGYYGAHHLDIEVDGLVFELQIMSKQLWQKKSVAHKIYSTTRSTGATNKDKEISRQYFRKGNLPKNECIEVDELSFVVEDLEDFDLFEDVE